MVMLDMLHLAPISYYALLLPNETVMIEGEGSFTKSTYCNRCHIVSSTGLIKLTVPIAGGRERKQAYRNVKIAYQENWQRVHWTSIKTAYGNAPFFEFYEDYFQAFYATKYEYLFDLNHQMMQTICNLLGIKTNLIFSSQFDKKLVNGFVDLRSSIRPNQETDMLKAKINSLDYYQVFADKIGFHADLSIIDLLFNEGPQSIAVLNGLVKQVH